MPLWLLGPLVVIAVSFVVALVHVSGGTKTARFRDEAEARAAAAEAFPGLGLGIAMLSADRGAAFFEAGGKVAALLPLGNRQVARLFAPGEAEPAMDGGTALRFPASDTATPAMIVRFSDRGAAEQVHRWFREPAHA